MRKPIVLIETSPVVDSTKSGVGYYTLSLIKFLAEYKTNKLTFLLYYFNFLNRSNKGGVLPKNLSVTEIRFIPGKLIPLFKKVKRLPYLDIFLHKKFDFIIYTNYIALPNIKNKPYALVVYDLGFLDCPDFIQTKNLKSLNTFCPKSITNASLVITISEYTKERIEHYFPETKGKIVITPIPPFDQNITKQILPTGLKKLGIEPKQFILFLGTVEPRKNIINLINAYEQLPSKIRAQYSLVIAGGSGWKDEDILAKISQSKNNGFNIIQTGYITDGEKESLYSNAKLFVLPSHYEGFGMPILEAMQYGVPCAVSDIAVFHEVANDAAVYFNKNDPADITKHIEKILTDNRLAESLKAKGLINLSRFSWENNAKIVVDAITEIVSKD